MLPAGSALSNPERWQQLQNRRRVARRLAADLMRATRSQEDEPRASDPCGNA